MHIFIYLSVFMYSRNFFARTIKSETKEETEIQKVVSIEKIKSEIHLQDVRSNK